MCVRGMKILALLGMLVWAASSAVAVESAGFDDAVGPFLEKYCLRCHNEKEQEGEFRLDTLSRDFTDADAATQWDEVIFRLNAGEMPPEDEPQPSPEGRASSTRTRFGTATTTSGRC
jgi:hypothetical protein